MHRGHGITLGGWGVGSNDKSWDEFFVSGWVQAHVAAGGVR